MKVILMGPSIERAKGGMATVEKLIFQSMPAEVQIIHVISHEYGSVFHRVSVFVQAMTRIVSEAVKPDTALFHLFLSQKGSALRVAIAILLILPFKKPIIIHAHSSQFHLFYESLPELLQTLLSLIFRQCSCFIALSQSWRKYYIESLGLIEPQAVVLPNPVQLPDQVPDRPIPDAVQIIFLGRIGQRKGAYDLIRAFAILPEQQRQSAKLLLAGDGEVEQARQLVQELELQHQITIKDWIDAEERDRLLSQSHIFILPSYNEGLPIALLEAMGWGLPSIATPVGGIPELVVDGENGLLVTPGNVEEISAAMQRLIGDSSLRTQLGTNGRKSVEPLEIHHYCNSLVELYRSVDHCE